MGRIPYPSVTCNVVTVSAELLSVLFVLKEGASAPKWTEQETFLDAACYSAQLVSGLAKERRAFARFT